MIELRITSGKTFTNLSNLQSWDKNPREIQDEDFARLKRQLMELGQYKPLFVTEDGVVVGGNMRFKAYQALGVTEVWVSILGFADIAEKAGHVYALVDGKVQKMEGVPPREFESREQAMIEYALSDNDGAGRYDKQALAELVQPYKDLVPMDNYKIEVYDPQPLIEIANSINGSGEEQRDDSDAEVIMEEMVTIAMNFKKEEYQEIEPEIENFKEENNTESNNEMFVKLLDFWSLNHHPDQPVGSDNTETPSTEAAPVIPDAGVVDQPVVEQTTVTPEVDPTVTPDGQDGGAVGVDAVPESFTPASEVQPENVPVTSPDDVQTPPVAPVEPSTNIEPATPVDQPETTVSAETQGQENPTTSPDVQA